MAALIEQEREMRGLLPLPDADESEMKPLNITGRLARCPRCGRKDAGSYTEGCGREFECCFCSHRWPNPYPPGDS